jgi:hypothetical protein
MKNFFENVLYKEIYNKAHEIIVNESNCGCKKLIIQSIITEDEIVSIFKIEFEYQTYYRAKYFKHLSKALEFYNTL